MQTPSKADLEERLRLKTQRLERDKAPYIAYAYSSGNGYGMLLVKLSHGTEFIPMDTLKAPFLRSLNKIMADLYKRRPAPLVVIRSYLDPLEAEDLEKVKQYLPTLAKEYQ